MAAAASSINPTAATAALSYLLIEHEPRRQRGEHDEKYVEVEEQAHRLVSAAGTPHRHLDRLAARDDERDEQRQREQRKQQLPSAYASHHGGEQAPDRGHADRGQQHRDDQGRVQRRAEEKRERGQQHRLADDQQYARGHRL